MNSANIHVNKMNHDNAIDIYNKILEIDPNYLQAHFAKGNSLMKLDKYREAIFCFNRLLDADPNNSDGLQAKAEAFKKLGKYDKALECYDQALTNNPQDITALRNKTLLLEELKRQKQKEIEESNAEIEKLLEESKKVDEEIRASERNSYDFTKQVRTCCALNCDVKENVLMGKECKFCNNFCCIEHLLCHKHDCVKDKHVKFIRKSWIRKYGQDISTGHYTVVCDVCGYVSQIASFIEIAGEERLSHISENGCDSKKVFLEGIV